LLGARLSASQVVVLHSGRAYFSLVSAPDWVSGAYDGKIRISVEEGMGDGGRAQPRARARDGSRASGHRAPAGSEGWPSGRRAGTPRRKVAAAVAALRRSKPSSRAFARPGPRDGARLRPGLSRRIPRGRPQEGHRLHGDPARRGRDTGTGPAQEMGSRRRIFAGWKEVGGGVGGVSPELRTTGRV
jgi:hypothetical protein